MDFKKPETQTYILPSCWASYLINGDASEIDDKEAKECDEFCEGKGYCVDVGESYYSHNNDTNNMVGGEVAEYTFICN